MQTCVQCLLLSLGKVILYMIYGTSTYYAIISLIYYIQSISILHQNVNKSFACILYKKIH